MTTQYSEILRLASLGLSGRSIADSVSCSCNNVSEVLARAVKLGVEWPVPLEVGGAELRKLLFPDKEKESSSRTPDCEYIHRELAKPGVTMALLNVITKIALIWSIPPRRSYKKRKTRTFFAGERGNFFRRKSRFRSVSQ